MTTINLGTLIIYLCNTKYYLLLVSAADRYISIREVYLSKVLEKNNILSKIILYHFRYIIYFHYYCQQLGKKISAQALCILFTLIALFFSVVNLVWIAWIFLFLILRFELSFTILHRFYQRRLHLIPQHFPDSQDPKRRMHKAVKVVVEAIQQNPVATNIIVFGGTFTAYKYVEYRNAESEAIQREKDREAEAIQREKDREIEAIQRQKDREAEDKRHTESLKVEALERQKDREYSLQSIRDQINAEDRRHKETLEAQNIVNRDTRMAAVSPEEISSNQNIESEIIESSLIVD